jgi:hypothetical protein
MALTLIQTPPQLLLSQQPAVFIVSTDYDSGPLRIIGRLSGESGDSAVPPPDYETSFELSDYLKGLTSIPILTANTPLKYTNIPKPLTFTFEEYYGTPPAVVDDIISDTFYLLDGKIPESFRKSFYTDNASLLAYLVSSKSCLTWWPATEAKRVFSTQKEYLNYLQVQNANPVNLKLVIALLLDDNTAVAGPTQSEITAVSYMGLVYFPTGYTQLGIDNFMAANYPDHTVVMYYAYVAANTTPYSKVYSYLLNQKYYERVRELYIRNPFGALEVLLCTGSGSKTTEHKPESAVTDGIITPPKINWKNIRTDIVNVNTGYMTAAQIQWLDDLLDTTEAYELISGALYPILLRDCKIQPVHDGEYQFSATLEYEYSTMQYIEIG